MNGLKLCLKFGVDFLKINENIAKNHFLPFLVFLNFGQKCPHIFEHVQKKKFTSNIKMISQSVERSWSKNCDILNIKKRKI